MPGCQWSCVAAILCLVAVALACFAAAVLFTCCRKRRSVVEPLYRTSVAAQVGGGTFPPWVAGQPSKSPFFDPPANRAGAYSTAAFEYAPPV
jgi:hypothetical protein